MRILRSSKRRVNHRFTIEPTTPEAEMEVTYCRLIPYIQISLGTSGTSLAQTYNSPTQPEKSERRGGGILKPKSSHYPHALPTSRKPPSRAGQL